MILLMILLLSAGCTGTYECQLDSSVAGFLPRCDAWLVRYPDETRLFIDEVFVAYLPAGVSADTEYGGTSGNPLTVLLGERLARSPESSLSFGETLSEVWIDARFEEGRVIGPVLVTLTTAD